MRSLDFTILNVVERALVVPLMKMVRFLPPLLIALSGMVQAQEPAATSGYKLQPGDVLTVNVWKETDLKDDVLIRPDGHVAWAGDTADSRLAEALTAWFGPPRPCAAASALR